VNFKEAIQEIEGNSIEDFEQIWNLAVEECARIADECLEGQIAHEFREYVKVK